MKFTNLQPIATEYKMVFIVVAAEQTATSACSPVSEDIEPWNPKA